MIQSLAVALACLRVEWTLPMPYVMWIHVAVVLSCVHASFEPRRRG